ncbi:MAG TPA: PPOX class F420-dependent oxidoreductase [Candidatus Binatia bacterium]|jgi:PPOX class probable F420-dependent enzyme
MQIPQSVRELLPKAPLAHLTTLNSDGSPQVTVVWVGIENEEFVIGHLAAHKKVRNVQHDPRVALSLLGDKTNAQGLREYVVVYGNARVTEGGAVDLLQRLGRVYLGPSIEFPPAPMRNIPGYITRITATGFTGVGPWSTQGAE